jgi:hypothetical protein
MENRSLRLQVKSYWRKISGFASQKKLEMIAQLSYCLPLFSNTWGLDHYRDQETWLSSFTKEDDRKLQVIQVASGQEGPAEEGEHAHYGVTTSQW